MSMKMKEQRTFASVLADGLMHITVTKDTPGAKLREYETSDKKKGEKWELVYSELIGKITKIEFYEGDFGTSIQVTVVDGEEEPVVLSLGTSSSFGEDFMKKLPNIDLKREVKIVPFSFEDDKGKLKKGVTVYQHDAKSKKNEKVDNYFYDPKSKKNIHGYPEPSVAIKKLQKEGKKVPSEKWKLYFGECREFLVEFITEHFGLDDEPKSGKKDELDEAFESADKAMEDDK